MTIQSNDIKLVKCPALVTLQVISGKWKTRILWLLRQNNMHFAELKNSLKGISAKMLTEHLRQLESEGIIVNIREGKHNPISSTYGYTDYGKTLVPVLDSIGKWGLIHESRS